MFTKSMSDAFAKVQLAGKGRIDEISRAFQAEAVARPVARFLRARPRLRSSFDRFTLAVQKDLTEQAKVAAVRNSGHKDASSLDEALTL